MEHYDVIIIGTGAGGGTLAHRLAPSGKRILVLERGGYLPRERENWDSGGLRPRTATSPTERWHDKDGSAFHPHTQYFVGGNTKVYGAIAVPPARARLRRGRALRRRLAGVADLLRRPRALLRRGRAALLVHGQRGEDPTEPPALGPVPVPGGLARAAHPAAARRPRAGRPPAVPPAGRRRPGRVAIPRRGRCMRCDRFDGFPCLTDGKADAHVLCVRPALKHAERDAADARAGRAAGDRRRRADGHRGRGRPRRRARGYSADIVVVSCGAINSAALLLRSASDQHPNGLAQLARTSSGATTWRTSTRP